MEPTRHFDHGVIGNRMSSALVSSRGSIEWCCLPYLDSPSHFGASVNRDHGGYFQILPNGTFRSKQVYLPHTNVLQTLFDTPHGRGSITDWMPIQYDPVICREVEVTEGKVTWTLTCTPRFKYGTISAQAERHRNGILFRGNQNDDTAALYSSIPLDISSNGSSAISQFDLNAGEMAPFAWVWGRYKNPFDLNSDSKSTFALQRQSVIDYWRKVSHKCPQSGCSFAGPWHDSIVRSQLFLLLMVTPYSGSIAQAISVSLHGLTPGPRIWGHRYASLRNGALHLQALSNLGCAQEAKFHFEWLSEMMERDGAEALQAHYTLDGGKVLREKEIAYLNRTEGSGQFQLDIYGHAVVAASEYFHIFRSLPKGLWTKISDIADYICHAWKRPDHGPWGFTSRPEHFAVSKLFCWAALDRACKLAQALDRKSPPRWTAEKEILHRVICDQGFDLTHNSFVRSFGTTDLDLSSLWFPLLEFLPVEDPRIQGTLTAIQSELSHGVLLKRIQNPNDSRRIEVDDLWATFIFITCLALSGRTDEASDRLAEACTYANPVGLFADRINPQRIEISHEFPSASVHLALVNAALYVGRSRGLAIPTPLLGFKTISPLRAA